MALATYLYDKNGRQVTPSVENQLIEDGDPKRNNTRRFERAISGLDYVLNPRSNQTYANPIKIEKDNVQEDQQIGSANDNLDEDENKDEGGDVIMHR